MRFLVFSASSGACLGYHDFLRRDGGVLDAAPTALRLFQLNGLLLQATETGEEAGRAQPGTAGSGALGAPTVLGAGVRRSGGSAARSNRARLALRQWVLEAEQWHLAEDGDSDVVAALCVPAAWSSDAAVYLTRALRDAFVQAHRPQLMGLALTASTSAAAALSASFGGPGPSSGLGMSLRSSGSASSNTGLKRPNFLTSPGGHPVSLIGLQALKLFVRLALDALDALGSDGLSPSWLYVVHAESFMGAHLMKRRPGAVPKAKPSTSASGGAPEEAHGKKSGGLKGMFGLLGRKSKDAAAAAGSGAGSLSRGGSTSSTRSGTGVSGSGQAPGSDLDPADWLPGPTGHLQHLVLRPERLEAEARRRGERAFKWEASTIAAAVLQVKPPEDQYPWHPPPEGAAGPSADPGEGGGLLYPELEDVELELELQPTGGGPGPARRFSVVGVRQGHVMAVVAQPTNPPPEQGPAEDVTGGVAPGSLSRVRLLLGPFLPAMSGLMHALAHWVPQEELAAHRLLLRLLDEHHGRIRIRYHEDDTTYYARPKLLRRMFPSSKRVLVARHTFAYRDAMIHNIERRDVCLEVGCHEGLTTNIIANRATHVVGIDLSPEAVALAAARHPHLGPAAFVALDGLDTGACAALAPEGAAFSRVCIDISGKAPVELICQMIRAQLAAFPAAQLIVKNEQLYDALAVRQGRTDALELVGIRRQPPEAVERAARLPALLGEGLLGDCELFVHQFRPQRVRPVRAKTGVRAPAPEEGEQKGQGQGQQDAEVPAAGVEQAAAAEQEQRVGAAAPGQAAAEAQQAGAGGCGNDAP
ncbi:hypothetical protein HYH03_005824 [Edaphochlamys debaryana]|uniref:Methyltransferase type 11 domain-containing protein n=1 Tax=Edaphochlamys debaryana TaxID=47281 RepID=A0A836C0U6_9CHLO|nr:hypothetical protein HYH03_005824 [Edaphochlamys debaryana]|eukprot:KAG2496226.1 hypothetical protein HYH03_005824 [Edaphochlamys debaryana]